MKSVIIKNAETGQVMIHIKRLKNGQYDMKKLNSLTGVDVIVIGDKNSRVIWKGEK